MNPVGSRQGRVLATLGTVVVIVVAVGAWAVTRSPGDPTSAPVNCDPGAAIPAGLPSRDVRRTPFSADSPWNRPVERQPTAAETTSALTRAFRSGTATGDPSDLGAVRTWINAEQYSLPLFQADPCDPVVTFEQDWQSEDLESRQLRIPDDAVPDSGTDGNLLVVQPDGHTLLELFRAERLGDDRWKTSRIELVDLRSTGMGPDNGVRAFGGSAYGGLIRTWEVDPADPDHDDGSIRHGLAIAVPNSMLLYTGGQPGSDGGGYGTNLGYVPPATDQDADSPWTYRGVIPMGSQVVLPSAVDIDSLGLGPEVRAVAVALQTYGGYVVDRAGDGVVTFYGEPTLPSAWLDAARQPDDQDRDLDRLRSLLVVLDAG